MQLKTNQFMEKAMNELFRAVGLKEWDKELTKQEGWYFTRTWNQDQVKSYRRWFLKEIKQDLKLNKKQAEKEWQWFNLCWGWKEEVNS